MQGVNAKTGKRLGGHAHLRQSVFDILTTPVGSRVLRREYGSELPSLVDNPQDERTRVRIVAATAGALARFEPRLQLQRATVQYVGPGQFSLHLAGRDRETGEALLLTEIMINGNRPRND